MDDEDALAPAPMQLEGRTALVTGVSRRRGIGFAVAARLAERGASVVIHHHTAHDADQYGAADDIGALVGELRERLRPGARIAEVPGDLGTPQGPGDVVAAAGRALGHLDVLVCNQAHGGRHTSC